MNQTISRKRSMDDNESVKDEAERAERALRGGADTMQRDMSSQAESALQSATEMAQNVSTKLKTVGVDTDVMVTAAKDQASELQKLLADELRLHPMRTLGIAAAVGLVVGFMTTR
jgi:ElaB/YqjD/DUF883 family membrane-anchored ribosome-binding protein